MRLMRGVLVLLGVLSLLAGAHARAGQPGDIRLVSEEWEGYTQADGSGLGWDVLRLIFEPAGVRLSHQVMPYTRAVGLVQRGEADAWVGAYRNEVAGKVFFPRQHYDSDIIVALGRSDTPRPTLQDLGRYRLVGMRGYRYNDYLPNVRHYHEVQRRSGILGMLLLGHADFYVDARPEVEQILSEADEPDAYRISELTRLPLYLGFADTPRGRSLAAVYDRRLVELIGNGKLRPVFARWRQPYPFK